MHSQNKTRVVSSVYERNNLQLKSKACAHYFSFFHQKTALNPSRPNSGRRENINLNFYFQTSLWCLKRLKPFDAPRKSVKIKI